MEGFARWFSTKPFFEILTTIFFVNVQPNAPPIVIFYRLETPDFLSEIQLCQTILKYPSVFFQLKEDEEIRGEQGVLFALFQLFVFF